MEFDYYYGMEAEQFSFYRIPRTLVKEAHAAGLNAEDACAFERVPAEPRRITYGCPLSEEAEAVLLIRGRMGDREAKRVFFAAYEGLVRKRAAAFYHHGNGRRILGDYDEAVSLACGRSTRQWMRQMW